MVSTTVIALTKITARRWVVSQGNTEKVNEEAQDAIRRDVLWDKGRFSGPGTGAGVESQSRNRGCLLRKHLEYLATALVRRQQSDRQAIC